MMALENKGGDVDGSEGMSGEESENSKHGSGSESGGMSGSKASKMQSSGPGES